MPRLNRLLAGAVLALAATTAFAADDAMTVHFKQSRRVQLSGQAANVVIGDPAVADVAMLDSHSVLVLGKGFGTTDILVLDRSGRTLMDSHVTVTAPDDGRVTIYRGAKPTEMSCAMRCQTTNLGGGAAAPSADGNSSNSDDQPAAPASGTP